MNTQDAWIAFAGSKCIASGKPQEVAAKVKLYADKHTKTLPLVFDASTSRPVEIDLRGNLNTVLRRLPATPIETSSENSQPAVARTPGRPKLGVIAREVTLLPRHWEWLATQPGGISVALRKLVETAQKANAEKDRLREMQESTYRFITAMAGNEPGYEEATRALFAGKWKRFRELIEAWPRDIRAHAVMLVETQNSSQPIT